MNRYALILLLFLGVGAMHAHAQQEYSGFFELRVQPSPAYAGQALRATVYHRPCTNYERAGAATVAVVGQVVTVTVTMEAEPNLFCFAVPPPDAFHEFVIGSMAPGDYTLVLQAVATQPGVIYQPVTRAFSVGPAIQPIPAASTSSLLLLALMLAVGAWAGMRMRDH